MKSEQWILKELQDTDEALQRCEINQANRKNRKRNKYECFFDMTDIMEAVSHTLFSAREEAFHIILEDKRGLQLEKELNDAEIQDMAGSAHKRLNPS